MTSKPMLKPKDFRQETANILLSSVAINLLSLALPIMTLQIYDRILPNPESGTLVMLMIGVSIAIMIEAMLRLARSYMIGWSGAAYEYGMSAAAMRHILNADISKMRGYGVGEHLHRMGALGKMRDFYNGYVTTATVDMLFVPVFLGFIIYVSGPLAIVPAAMLMIFTLVSLAEGQVLRKRLKERDQSDDHRYNFLIESLDGVHTLKSFALENIFCRKYEALQDTSARANYNTAEATAGAFNTGAIMSHLMMASVIAGGAWFVLQGQVTAGALVATLILSGRMMQMIQRGLILWVKYQDYQIAREKSESIFAIPAAKTRIRIADTPAKGTLELKDVSFSFHDGGAPILKNANITLNPGDTIAISGENASGKSTLLGLIAGIFPATSGEIIVDGENILKYAPEKLARHVGYIPTQPVIFRGTIRDNITRFGEIDDASARKFASLLGVDRDVAKLTAGFDTVLHGNGSDVVPTGLKQRIAMARTFAAKPRIVLFDEADSSLDREGFHLVFSLMSKLRESCAMIIISEDPHVAGLATQHLLLDNGILKPVFPVRFDKKKVTP